MTREEIINEIKCLLSELDNGEDAVSYLTQNDVKWLNENIKALDQEPCEDCISRQAVLDTTICEGISCNECSFNEIDGEPGCLLHKRIDDLPSVTPQPKIGHWIPKTKNWWECSECGQMIYSETESDKLKFHAFCGRCGSKMVNVPDKNDGKLLEIPAGSESEDKE